MVSQVALMIASRVCYYTYNSVTSSSTMSALSVSG